MTSEWAPLEQVLGPRLCGHFMFMGRSGELYLYKHIDTRRYLNLDAEGRCFRYTGKEYAPEELRKAIAHVLS
ncbi:MAG: hypothetical protein WBD93_15945 [Acidobacteriaceae bacterium]